MYSTGWLLGFRMGQYLNLKQEFDYYPTEWFEPYISRRRAVGFELYKLLNIARDDFKARDKQVYLWIRLCLCELWNFE